MDSLLFYHPFVAVWRVDYFFFKYRNLRDGDLWSSELFAMQHPDFGPLKFTLNFMKSVGKQTMSLTINEETMNFSFTANYEAWMEISDGKRSDVKKSQFTFSDNIRQQFFPVFSTEEIQRLITLAPVFLCCRLPFPVKIIGIVLAGTITYRWTIDRFRWFFDYCGLQQFWESDVFDGFDGTKFTLLFYPKESEKTCGLYLKIVEKANQLVVRSHYELWIKNKNNQRLYKLASYNHFHGGDLRGWSSYTSRKKLLELAAEDSIVICCNLHPVIDHQLSGNGSSYFREFARSFDIDRFSDTQFHVNHRIYKVSKAVICAKSSVFQAMFTLSTKEKRTGIVQIMGIETKLIEMLLKFIYTGEVENLKNVAGDLLFVADCYDVKLLVEKCIGSLVENLSIDNVVSVLKYSFFLEHVKNFKSRVLKFAYDHGAELVHLPEWNKLKLEHPIIAVELLQLAFV